MVFPHIKANDQIEFIDYKSLLQEYVQSETRASLVYKDIKKEGTANLPTFTISVILEGIVLGTGKGRSKKKHRKQLLKMLCRKLRKIDFSTKVYKNDEKTCKRINNVL